MVRCIWVAHPPPVHCGTANGLKPDPKGKGEKAEIRKCGIRAREGPRNGTSVVATGQRCLAPTVMAPCARAVARITHVTAQRARTSAGLTQTFFSSLRPPLLPLPDFLHTPHAGLTCSRKGVGKEETDAQERRFAVALYGFS